MNKLELTFALEQIARGFPRAATDLADHFFPESLTIGVAVPQATPGPFPSAEVIEAMKAAVQAPSDPLTLAANLMADAPKAD